MTIKLKAAKTRSRRKVFGNQNEERKPMSSVTVKSRAWALNCNVTSTTGH